MITFDQVFAYYAVPQKEGLYYCPVHQKDDKRHPPALTVEAEGSVVSCTSRNDCFSGKVSPLGFIAKMEGLDQHSDLEKLLGLVEEIKSLEGQKMPEKLTVALPPRPDGPCAPVAPIAATAKESPAPTPPTGVVGQKDGDPVVVAEFEDMVKHGGAIQQQIAGMFLRKYDADQAMKKEGVIRSVRHISARAYKELPHFFKFSLFKPRPRPATEVKDSTGRVMQSKYQDSIKMNGIDAEVTYYGGELGSRERRVFFSIINQAIEGRDFLEKHGFVVMPYDKIVTDCDFDVTDHHRFDRVKESIEKLRLTDIKFNNSFGEFQFSSAFHLINSVTTISLKEFLARVEEVDSNPGAGKKALDRFQIKSRTPKITIVKFNDPLIEAILGNQISTVDMWALNCLDGDTVTENLFLHLWDISQWKKQKEHRERIGDLLKISGLQMVTVQRGNKIYPSWRRACSQLELHLKKAMEVAKFLRGYKCVYLRENTEYVFTMADQDQIDFLLPSTSPRSTQKA